MARRCCLPAIFVSLMVVQLVTVSGTRQQADIVTEITKALSARKDLSNVVKYLELSRAELVADLPLVNKEGTIFMFLLQ